MSFTRHFIVCIAVMTLFAALSHAVQIGTAIMYDNLKLVLAEIEQDPYNQKVYVDAYCNAPLAFAAKQGRLRIVQALVEKGISLKVINAFGQTPLHVAASTGQVETVRYLIGQKQLDVNAKDAHGSTPLHLLAILPAAEDDGIKTPEERLVPTAMVLVTNGARVDVTDGWGRTPLSYAAEKGHVALCAYLLKQGANPNALDIQGVTPLRYAVEAGQAAVIETLKRGGATLDAFPSAVNSPLHIAVAKGNLPMVRQLIANRATLSAKNEEGDTPLHLAISQDNFEMVKYLLQQGANVNATNLRSETPLLIALGRRQSAIIQFLLEQQGVEINKADYEDNTPLHWAITWQCSIAIVQLLLDKGANVSAVNYEGETPLHIIDDDTPLPVCQLLVNRGADLSATSLFGMTPFLIACQFNQEFALLLLDQGVDFRAMNAEEETALHFAALGGHVELLTVLLAKGLDINALSLRGDSPLHNALSVEVARWLLEHKANVDASGDGFTPLHMAVDRGDIDLVDLLLKHGANRSIRSEYLALTPLEYAERLLKKYQAEGMDEIHRDISAVEKYTAIVALFKK